MHATPPTARFPLALPAAFVALLLAAAAAHAQKVDKGKLDAAARRSGKAAKVLTDLSALPPAESIPRELLERARAVAVFPDVDRANILFLKAMKGYGLMSRRVEGSWTTPAFYGFAVIDKGWSKVAPANAGVVMLFMDDDTLKKFEKDHVRFEAAAGPVGELTAEGEKRVRDAGVIMYALSDGKLRGVEVEDDTSTQNVINSDNNVNKAVFGLKAREVLWGKQPANAAAVPPAIAEFQHALASLSKR